MRNIQTSETDVTFSVRYHIPQLLMCQVPLARVSERRIQFQATPYIRGGRYVEEVQARARLK